jgi:hypothetical protein
MVTEVPTGPDVGLRVVMVGVPTVKVTPLLATPPTVTTTLPVVAPPGTGTTMLVALQLAMCGVTEKFTPLLATPPTVTTTFPVVAPLGTTIAMLVALQLVGVPAVPLKVTVLDPWMAPKFVPVIVSELPTAPDVGFRLVMLGPEASVNATPLLATPPTVTTTFPVVAALGTGTTMLVALQPVGVAAVPLKVTVLDP